MPKSKGSWRKVPVDIHNDPRFRDLSMTAGYLLFHIHTHPQMSSMGCMRHSPEGLAAELRRKAPMDAVLEAFRELIAAGYLVADVDASFIGLPDFFAWAPVSSPNLVKSWGDLLEHVPRCAAQADYFERVAGHVESLGDSYSAVLPEAFRAVSDAVPNAVQNAVSDAVSDDVPNAVSDDVPDAVSNAVPNAVPDAAQSNPDTPCRTLRDQRSEIPEGSKDPGGDPPKAPPKRKLTPQQTAASAIAAVFEEAGVELANFGALMRLQKRYRSAKLPPLPEGVGHPDPPVWHLCRDLRSLDLASAADPESFALKCLGNALRNGRAGRIRAAPARTGSDAGRNAETEERAAIFDDVIAKEGNS
ncbi:MAG: hypothetical protein AAGD06_22485 [Acidobacteriota bacterium]